MLRRSLLCAGFAALLAVVGPGAGAGGRLELLMFDDAYCPYCVRWHEEIGVIYAKTDEGRTAPLRPITHDEPMPPGIELSEPLRVTPTFVLLDDGREVGRITGYAGDDFFFGMLADLIARAR